MKREILPLFRYEKEHFYSKKIDRNFRMDINLIEILNDSMSTEQYKNDTGNGRVRKIFTQIIITNFINLILKPIKINQIPNLTEKQLCFLG